MIFHGDLDLDLAISKSAIEKETVQKFSNLWHLE